MPAKKRASKKDVRSLMRRKLGRETADAMLNKMDKMAKKRTPPSAIEKTVAEDLSKHVRKLTKELCIPIVYGLDPKP